MKIFICGFTGAGKSTLGSKLIDQMLNFRLLDLDREISKSLNISEDLLGNAIDKMGWNKFREVEKIELEKIIKLNQNILVSLGGGSLSSENYQLIKGDSKTKLIFLNTPFDICYERIKKDLNRPISKLAKEELEAIFLERLEMYKKADAIVEHQDANSIEALQRIVHNLCS